MKLWFKARQYGWGWDPVSWQGWVVVLLFIGGFVWSAFSFVEKLDAGDPSAIENFVLRFIALLLGLMVVASLTGEKPHWSWGKKK